MPVPKFITFTGIDNRTDFDRLRDLSSRYPIEWGILFGDSLAERHRYPNLDTIEKALSIADDRVRFSAHLCGWYAKQVMNEDNIAADFNKLLGGDQFSRYQINSRQYDMTAVRDFADMMGKPIIIQVREDRFPEPVEGIYYLHDRSGGRGELPATRPSQGSANPFVGHAGGVNPANVLSIADSIDAYNYWLDLETGGRTPDDWLDLDKCESICEKLWPSVPEALPAQEIA